MEFELFPLKGDIAFSKLATLEFPFEAVREALGEPYYNGGPDFPGDQDKTDVFWSLRTEGGPLLIWNYKNGPACYQCDEVEDIDYFSVWYTDVAVYQAAIKAIREAVNAQVM